MYSPTQTEGMKIRTFIFPIFCCLATNIYTQENITRVWKDSLKIISKENIDNQSSIVKPFNIEGDMPEIKIEMEAQQMGIQEIKLRRPFYMPYHTNPSPMFYGDYSTGGMIAPNLYGYGSQSTLPGIGRINEASLMYQYNINDYWEIQAGLNATKFNFPFSTGQALGTSGAVIYRPNDRLSFRAFGSYAPASAYGFQMSSFGGTIGYEFNDRWGMEVGAERIYDPMRRSWDTRPIAIPYYKFNKTKIGLDVGGILYEVIRNAKFKNQGGNPTIMPGR